MPVVGGPFFGGRRLQLSAPARPREEARGDWGTQGIEVPKIAARSILSKSNGSRLDGFPARPGPARGPQ